MYPIKWHPLVFLVFLIAACSPVASAPVAPIPGGTDGTVPPQGTEAPLLNPYAPATGDASMIRADVDIESLAILTGDSFPPSYVLQVKGSLPTPCHQLRTTVDVPAADSVINVQVYSVVDPYRICAQVVQPFEASVPLGSFVRGSYKVIVNGKSVGQITP